MGVGVERRVGKRILAQFERAFGAVQAGAGFIGCGTARIHLGVRRPALGFQILCALLGRGGLGQDAGRGGLFSLGLLGLELQVDLVEGGERLADFDGLADLHETLGDLAGNPKAEIALDSGTDGADEAALGRLGIIVCRRD